MGSFMLTRPKRIRHHMNAMWPDPPSYKSWVNLPDTKWIQHMWKRPRVYHSTSKPTCWIIWGQALVKHIKHFCTSGRKRSFCWMLVYTVIALRVFPSRTDLTFSSHLKTALPVSSTSFRLSQQTPRLVLAAYWFMTIWERLALYNYNNIIDTTTCSEEHFCFLTSYIKLIS